MDLRFLFCFFTIVPFLFFFAGGTQVIFQARRAAGLAARGAGVHAPLAVQVLAGSALDQAACAVGTVTVAAVADAVVAEVLVADFAVVAVISRDDVAAVGTGPAFPVVQRHVGTVGVVGLQDRPDQQEEVADPTFLQSRPDG